MISSSSYRSSFSKTNKIKCSICREKVLLQNYSVHLQRRHPNEDSKDLCADSEVFITALFKAGTQRDSVGDENLQEERSPPVRRSVVEAPQGFEADASLNYFKILLRFEETEG